MNEVFSSLFKGGGALYSVGRWTMFDNVQVSQTNFIACRWDLFMQLNGTLREIVSKREPILLLVAASWCRNRNIFTTRCSTATSHDICAPSEFNSLKSILLVHFIYFFFITSNLMIHKSDVSQVLPKRFSQQLELMHSLQLM